MSRLQVLVALYFSVFLVFGAPASAKDNDDTLTLTIDATCVADAKLNGQDLSINDKVIGTLREQAIYRIVSAEGGRLELELVEHRNAINISGGGTYKDPIESRSWTYNAGEPAIDNVQGGVSVNVMNGTGTVFILNFMQGGKIKASPDDIQRNADGVADMTVSTATGTSFSQGSLFESNESFLEGLNFTFDPKSKQIASSGHANYQMTWRGEDGGFVGTGKFSVNYSVTSGVPQADIPETEVSVETQSHYTAWLPEGNLTNPDSPGNNLAVRIKAHKKGDPSTPHRAYLKIMLSDVSKNQGVCMNWPRQSIQGQEGLRFKQEDFTGEESLTFVDTSHLTTSSAVEQVEFFVHAYDFGAWGTLQVEAIDERRREVTVKVREKDTSDLFIPMDENRNRIADSWEVKRKVVGIDAGSDLDESQGNLNHGDGFTLFEEYRGLLAEGKHRRLDPKQKELFVVNNCCGDVDAGIALFEAAADLKIIKGRSDEFDLSRVVNFHKNSASRGGDQHGLLIKFGETLGGTGLTQPVKSDATYTHSPGAVQQINFAKDFSTFGPAAAAKDVAHELGHACGLRHHGDAGTAMLDSNIYDSNGSVVLRPDDTTWILYDARGSVVTQRPVTLSGKVTFSKGSPAGGDVGCVMCYESVFSFAYQASSGNKQLASKPDVVPGTGLCTSAAGTFYNKKDHLPWPLFGDAQPGRGNCKSKVKIKDW